ncbi:vWA domain-containing protein [Paenibacillus paridis]|uniref:vWA domain-containing protein n=1 Tax=Paenibacillus paridis TaxID=2583376 RepID=UPI00111D68F3|nr:BatA and WFA domain-containing protein [Paenibacillus paridis]
MQFLSAASAWFAASLPVIATMYILKRTYENKEISSHLLWRKVLQEQEANRPWQKLRSRWLLILQLIVALLIVFALMEPVWLRAAKPTAHVVLLVDRSASMAAKPGYQDTDFLAATRLELAIQKASQWLDRQAAGRPVTLVATGAQPEVIASRLTNKEQIKERLESILPYYGKSDNAGALSLADSLLQEDPSGETVIFTDGYWSDAEEANKLRLKAPVDLVMVDEKQPLGNLSILYFGVKADKGETGTSNGVITVRNDSRQDQTVKLEIYAESSEKESILAAAPSIAVPAEEWQSVEIASLPPALYYKAHIQQLNDAVQSDNDAYQFPAAPRNRQALLITDGNLFLEKALQLAGVEPVKVSPGSAAPAGEQAAKVDWIVLDGSSERLVGDPEWSKLLSDKPLWLIDHPDQTDKTSVIPANTRVETKEHPVTSYLTFADTHIGRLALPNSADLVWGDAVLSYGGIPAVYAGTDQGKPKLRFTFNLQETDLPLRPEFPVLIVQAAQWMSGGSQLELGAAVAEKPLELSLHSETVSAAWEAVELAGGGLPAEQQRYGKKTELALDLSTQLTAPSVPGLFRLIESNKDGAVVSSRLLAVTADHSELQSNDSASETKLELTAIADSQAETSSSPANKQDQGQKLSLQLYAAIVLLLMMAAEWEVYRRGFSS